MQFDFEGFEGLNAELEDFTVRKAKKWDRAFKIGEGGSFCFTMMHEGVIYAPCGDHYVYAIEAKTGKEIWRFRTNDRNYGSPATDGKLLFTPSYDNHLYAVDIKTGKEVWRFKTGGRLFSTPGVCGGMVVFGSEDQNLYALDTATGKLLWRFKAGGLIASTITFYKNVLFFGACDHNIYCLDAKSGKEVWRFITGDDAQINRQMLIKDGRIYFAVLDNHLYCLDVDTGKEIWRFRTGKYGNVSTPSLYKNRLYHSTRDGIVYALTMDGKEIWRFHTGGFIAKNIVHAGVVYFGSEDSFFYAIDAETGKELWRYKAGAGILDDAKIIGDLLCFGSWDCHYYALDRRTGEEVWRFESSSQQIASVPSIESEYTFEIKKTMHIEDAISEEKYASKHETSVSLSDYHVKSEYSSTSDYKQKSDYDTKFVIFEEDNFISRMKAENIFLNNAVNLELWE
ncbi:MAG: PQQ-binding-like beta-propeller repeat protein [Candidatus Aenigmarchaeota archaeon]|nr:PQQ-binding-like beta-propeller repeat protein [Candidatus Aenigmarchaeota archaeon]